MVQQAGGDIEILPTQRAVQVGAGSGSVHANAILEYSAATPFSPSMQGVVFNYSLQQYGLTTGEIAFMIKHDSILPRLQLNPALRPTRILKSGVYVVTTVTPQSFLDTVCKLQQNSAVAWVQPTIHYETVQNSPSIR